MIFCTLNGCFAASEITGISIDGKEFSQKSKEILCAALIDIRSNRGVSGRARLRDTSRRCIIQHG